MATEHLGAQTFFCSRCPTDGHKDCGIPSLTKQASNQHPQAQIFSCLYNCFFGKNFLKWNCRVKGKFVLDILKKKTTLKYSTRFSLSSECPLTHHVYHRQSQRQKKKSTSPVVYICIVLIINETECLLKLQFQRMSGWVHLKHQKREVAPGTKT